jgi:hypothetical protein
VANALFDSGREGFLAASMGWLAGSVPGTWVPYIIGSWNVDLTTAKRFLSDIPNTVWRARGTYLVTKGVVAGVASAANTAVAAVGSAGSATAVAIVLVNETGASQTSLLGAYVDTATGLPFLPNGADVNITWDTGANCIFKL